MNLEQAIIVYAGGPGSGCHGPNCGRPEGSGHPTGANTHNTRITMPSQSTPRQVHVPAHMVVVDSDPHKSAVVMGPGEEFKPAHVPDVQRDWRRKKFQTDPDNPAKYFRRNSFTAKVYMELAAKPNEWHSINELMMKHAGKSFHGTLFALRDVGKGTGKWTIERRGDSIRLVPTQKQGELFPRPSKLVDTDSPLEKGLKTKDVDTTDRLGGGVSETIKVRFKDGSFGVFKPNDGDGGHRNNIAPGNATVREVGAWEVAKVAGMDDLVTPTVFRTLGGREGSLQLWNEGDVAHKVEDRGGEMYDGDKDAARAAAFDWVIGNEDRHAGNWMVNKGKLRLIDHGLSFPDKKPYFSANARMIQHADDKDLPAPNTFAAPYVAGAVKIREVLQKIGMPEPAIQGVEERIRKLKSADSWGELQPSGGWS